MGVNDSDAKGFEVEVHQTPETSVDEVDRRMEELSKGAGILADQIDNLGGDKIRCKVAAALLRWVKHWMEAAGALVDNQAQARSRS